MCASLTFYFHLFFLCFEKNMGSLFMGYSSIVHKGLVKESDHKIGERLYVMNKRKKSVVVCHGNEFKLNSKAASSVLTERTTLVSNDHSSSLLEAGSSDLGPYCGQTSTTALMDIHDDDGIGIINFLRGKNLFITGATGFLAKVLIEKILRTMPDVGKIYVLIKGKNKEAVMQRLKNEVINTELFNGLTQKYGKSYQSFMLSKLIPVVGNICEANLGLDEKLADVIAKEVDVIVNSAANTTFDERYDVAIDINTRGPCRLVTFAKECKKLKLFLQISTAYVNGQRQGKIMEKAFINGDSISGEVHESGTSSTSLPPILNVEDEIKLALDSKLTFEDSATMVQQMKQLGLERANKYGWQDTYVFTKAMGEMVIDKMRGEIPVVIIRPSVIESTFKHPFPGWMEGNRMMDPIILYYGKGLLTGFLVNPNGVLDVVPADMVVNATLAAMAKHGVSNSKEINVYQIASSVSNPLVFKDLAALLYEHYSFLPCLDSKGRPIHVPEMKLFDSMDDFSARLWEDATKRSGLGAALDSSNENLSKKLETICRKSVEQAKYLANIYRPYTFYGGRFDNSNTEELMNMMSEEEKEEFGFDVGSIDWKDYITNVHIPGLRRHVMKGRGMSCTI